MQLRCSGFIRAAALLLAGALAAPLAAQERNPPPPAEDPIVVMGVRDRQEAVRNYVEGLTDMAPDEPVARYVEGEYCPAVLGLSPQRNAQIAARMRAVAAAADVEPGKEGCLPSALVIFVEDQQAFVAAFRKQHPTYFIGLRDMNLVAPRSDGPAVAWHLVQQVDPEGMPAGKIVESSMRGSRILSMVRVVVAMSVVVVERKALVGLTPTQIADYALMRSLTDRAPESLNLPAGVTILGALTAPVGSAVPASLTHWDLAYLKGRYSGHPSRYGQSQGAAIRNRMRRTLNEIDAK